MVKGVGASRSKIAKTSCMARECAASRPKRNSEPSRFTIRVGRTDFGARLDSGSIVAEPECEFIGKIWSSVPRQAVSAERVGVLPKVFTAVALSIASTFRDSRGWNRTRTSDLLVPTRTGIYHRATSIRCNDSVPSWLGRGERGGREFGQKKP